MNNIDIQKLRKDLMNYFGTAMFGVSPIAMMELSKVERASEEELLEIANENGFDIEEYYLSE